MPKISNPIFTPSGMVRVATLVKTQPDLMTATIRFAKEKALSSDESSGITAQLPAAFISSGGSFIGGYVKPGTLVAVSQIQGTGTYIIVAFLGRDPTARSSVGPSQIKIPELIEGQVTIQANTDGAINLNDDGITIGEPRNLVAFDTTRKLLLNSFDASYSITQSSRVVDGTILRDRNPRSNFASSLRLSDPSYNDGLVEIGMDPVAITRSTNIGNAIRNPPRVEKRELVFEYEDSADVQSDDVELKFYNSNSAPDTTNILNRRESRADTLSLSLVAPNYLMESIKGTVVDVFGNMVDLNRNIIPIGGKNEISVSNIKSTINESDTFKNAYEQIKRLERKSLAYHFEINAKKETFGAGPPDVNNKDNYARARSRFFLDIDKEGQFKLNVPASSETGNIPLLTRYENYSTVFPNDASKDPNDTVFNSDYRDILIESFINDPTVVLQDELGSTVGPIDRFSDPNNPVYLKHGTVYHDISKTIFTFQATNGVPNYVPQEYNFPISNIASGDVPAKTDVVAKQVITAGPKADAGGRSGSLNFDGSLEINIGANTVDRQSLWVDTQGGVIANIGRDLKNNISIAAKMDGEVLMEIGGSTVPSETKRFPGSSTGWMAGALDIRVYNANNGDTGVAELTILRIDNSGVTVTTPGRIVFSAMKDMMFQSGGQITIDAPTVLINSRKALKDPGQLAFR